MKRQLSWENIFTIYTPAGLVTKTYKEVKKKEKKTLNNKKTILANTGAWN